MADEELAEVAKAPLKYPHRLRHLFSSRLRSGWPRKQILGVNPGHAEQLLKILHYVSKRTSEPTPDPQRPPQEVPITQPPVDPPQPPQKGPPIGIVLIRRRRRHPPANPPAAFTKSGDLMIHATLYADLPEEQIAALSLYELPYELAGEHYGVKANHKARPPHWRPAAPQSPV